MKPSHHPKITLRRVSLRLMAQQKRSTNKTSGKSSGNASDKSTGKPSSNSTGKNSGKSFSWFKPLIVLLSAAIFAMSAALLFEWWHSKGPKFVRYDAFNIEVPVNYEIHGIDVSKYQQRIHWRAVKEMEVGGIRLGFAFIKATEGLKNVDKQFKRNWRLAKEENIARGAYHFFLATKSGQLQAQHFIQTVELEAGDLPPVLDVEQTYGVATANIKKEVRAWLETVEQYYGVKPILYTNVRFYEQYLGDEFDDYPLWVAHYLQKDRPRIGRKWTFWQYSETGTVNGIKGKVDFNVFKGDSTAFYQLLIPSTTQPLYQ
jgi:lysozyme